MFIALSKISGSLEDITRYTKKYGEGSKELTVASGDCIYLGTRVKFNHAFIKLDTVSATPIDLSVKLWSGSTFSDAARLTDETDGLINSGIIEFSPSSKQSWDNQDSEQIAEIESIKYYNLYWMKLEFASAGTFTIDYIGHKFSNDFDLFIEWPQLNNANFLAYFNQPDYEAQSIKAADLIEKDLIKQGVAESNLQILEWSDLTLASTSKVAEIVYGSFGNEYVDNVAALRKEYSARISSAYPIVDNNNTGIKETNKSITQGTLYR